MPADTAGYPPEFAALLDTYNQEVTALMARLEAGKVTSAAWTEEMQRLLSRYSQAARMLGMGEVKLLPAEVDAVRAWLNEQFKYLDGFETVINSAGGEYDPAWLPRAQMYGASTVTEYWEGKTSGLPLPAQPGQGSQCLSNCRCHWDIQWIDKQAGSADCFWVLNPTVENCQTCQTRAEMWNPVKIRQGNLEGDYITPATGPITPPRKPKTPKPSKGLGKNIHVTDEKEPAVAKNISEFNLLPQHVKDLFEKNDVQVYFGKGTLPTLNQAQGWAHVHPRGWPRGATWNKVAGGYIPNEKKVLLGVGSHGSYSLSLHESAHAWANIAMIDDSPELIKFHKQLYSKLNPYLQQGKKGGLAGRQELFAEAMAKRLISGTHYLDIPEAKEFNAWMDSLITGGG